MEALGACFQINGEIASKVPELLVRTKSIRLDRVSQWVGWMAGDTASEMAKTAGGRAASLLSLVLMELYDEVHTGMLLHELSSILISDDRNNAGFAQLGQVAATLHKKLCAIGFGSHLAFQVSRIREAYFNSGRAVPTTLLNNISVEDMVKLHSGLRRALFEEDSMLYIEGCHGIGQIVSPILCLCPDDAEVVLEHEIIHKGRRRSIYISIKADAALCFDVERIIHDLRITSERHLVPIQSTPGPARHLHLRWEGCLSETLELAFLKIGSNTTIELRQAVAKMITGIATEFNGVELCNSPGFTDHNKRGEAPFADGGVMAL
jgi:hypothetical protein